MIRLLKEDNIDSVEKISVQRLKVLKTIEEHMHGFVELEYILSGEGTQTINGCKRRVGRGSLILINFKDSHAIGVDGEMEYVNILMDPEFVSAEISGVNESIDLLALAAFSDFAGETSEVCTAVDFNGREMLELEELILKMLDEFKEKNPGYITMLKSYVGILLTMFLRRTLTCIKEGQFHDLQEKMKSVLQVIESTESERLTLRDLAGAGFYNPSYFSRMFKEQFGMTVKDYLCLQRMKAARKMLEETDLKLSEIAIRAGFGNTNSFYRIFRELSGMTPEKYRKASRKQVQQTARAQEKSSIDIQ